MNKNEAITYANPGVQMQSSHRQTGALLPLTLVILLVVTLLAISAVSSTNVNLQIAGNQQRQFEAEMVAENAVNFLVDNYPSRTMPTGANFETFGFSMGQGTPAEACVTKTHAGKGDYYSHMEIRVTATDPNSGATATAVKGLKYRGDGTNSTTIGSPIHADCGVTELTMGENDEDTDLPTNGQKKVLYSYLEID